MTDLKTNIFVIFSFEIFSWANFIIHITEYVFVKKHKTKGKYGRSPMGLREKEAKMVAAYVKFIRWIINW